MRYISKCNTLLYVLIAITIFVLLSSVRAENVDSWMPDTALQKLVRRSIFLPRDVPLTQLDMKKVKELIQFNSDIQDITGLEYAISLERIEIYGSHITNLSPLKELTSLTRIGIAWNRTRLTDISPLAKLTNLTILDLNANLITDITALSDLTNLEYLSLQGNYITDLSALIGLTNLVRLDIAFNPISDFSQIAHLSSVLSDKVCELPRLSIADRVLTRNYPSIVSFWGGIDGSEVFNREDISNIEKLALHDSENGRIFTNYSFVGKGEQTRAIGYVEQNLSIRDELLSLNPNMIFIAVIAYRQTNMRNYPKDWDGWLRDTNGNRVFVPGLNDTCFVDFTKPVAMDWVVGQAIAISHCGIYDGILFDFWDDNENTDIFFRPDIPSPTPIEQLTARIEILRRIREYVGNDFLITGNVNRRKIPHTAPYMNGGAMEAGNDDLYDGYTHEGLMEIESTLSWLEENTQHPQVNSFEARGVHYESPDSEFNRKMMRVTTTLHLTHSDGYFVYTTGIASNPHDHSIVRILDPENAQKHYEEKHQFNEPHTHDAAHYWYKFWDADLGQPVSEKGTSYERIDGLFIREFTNGWVIYNRSGNNQKIFLPMSQGVGSQIESQYHILGDLDGEIYLKSDSKPVSDINNDKIVNVLDLVIIANRFNKSQPDLNGDGIVNILDFVIVANAFSN